MGLESVPWTGSSAERQTWVSSWTPTPLPNPSLGDPRDRGLLVSSESLFKFPFQPLVSSLFEIGHFST